ncbi:hypothetical protein E1B28_005311 [Marasmius oreades]|uniref:GST N-terminal domain-containing protein n=1 Tax=Marasmius oreades TaxID=181124 RepID=A0A9P7V0E8_9AGAR|nr:uncharacterized protein E1B28_005311 [Marasmius oreades]KAG7098003.1 hypothetical protein E1B28_005311 [Marasmius oreades]
MITVYDLGPSKFPEHVGGSVHTRKVIFSLNYKKLPFKVSTITWGEIERTAKSIGAPPTTTHPDGSPKYTAPFIYDSSTGKSISDSLLIVEYLDKAYPTTPKLVPDGTRVLQAVFADAVTAKFYSLTSVFRPKFPEWFSPEFLAEIEKLVGPPKLLSQEETREVWSNGKKSFDELLGAYESAGAGKFVMGGDTPVFADLALAALFSGVKIMFGDESEEWKDVSGWIGGRVGKVVEGILKHERVYSDE